MPRQCTVCSHPQRGEIDAALARGTSPYQLEAAYTGLRKTALQRHRELHLPKSLLKAQAAKEVARADVLLEDIAAIRSAAFRALDTAEAAGDTTTMLRAIREARENVRILGELRGELNTAAEHRAYISPAAMQVLIQVLQPHPDLAEAVVEALEPLEAGDE